MYPLSVFFQTLILLFCWLTLVGRFSLTGHFVFPVSWILGCVRIHIDSYECQVAFRRWVRTRRILFTWNWPVCARTELVIFYLICHSCKSRTLRLTNRHFCEVWSYTSSVRGTKIVRVIRVDIVLPIFKRPPTFITTGPSDTQVRIWT